MATESANKITFEIDSLNHLVEKAKNEHRVFNEYKDLIEKSKKEFAEELKSILPGIDSNAKNASLTSDELNALIAHAYIRIEQFRQQLSKQQVFILLN